MIEKNDISWNSMSDLRLAETLGTFVRHHRMEQDKTQARLAAEAGISRSALNELENKGRSSIITFIQVLRALNMLHVFDHFRVQPRISPLQLARLEQSQRKRASRAKEKSKKNKPDW